MKRLSEIFFMFLIMSASNSFAFQMEIAQWIPWKIVNQELAQSISFPSLEKTNLQLNWQDWTPTLSSLKVVFTPKKVEVEAGPTGFSVRYGSLQDFGTIQIQVGEFAIDQTIYRDFGGNKIGIRIKAQCSPFTVDLPAMALAVHAPFAQDGNFVLPKAQDVELLQNQPAVVSTIQCFGPMGFEEKVTGLVVETLSKSEVIAQFIKTQLQQITSDKLTTAFKNWMLTKNQKAVLTGSSAPFAEGLYIHFLTPLAGTEGEDVMALNPELLVNPPEEGQVVQTLISQDQLHRIVEENMKSQQILKYNLQSIPSFSSFMNNRFLQLFVWSDLLHYSRKAPFFLNTEKMENLEITSSKVGEWVMKFQTRGNIESERKGKTWIFMNWSMGVSSRMSLQIQSGKALISTSNSLSNFSSEYGADYDAAFSPSKPSLKILKKAVESALTQKSFEINLPKIQVLGAEWKMSRLKTQGEAKDPQVFIEWIP